MTSDEAGRAYLDAVRLYAERVCSMYSAPIVNQAWEQRAVDDARDAMRAAYRAWIDAIDRASQAR